MIFLWPLVLALLSLPLFHAPTNRLLELAALSQPVLTGGCLFVVGGLLGETLKARLSRRAISPAGLFAITFMWWLAGAIAAIVFPLVNLGVNWSQALGLLPGGGFGSSPNPLLAIFSSFIISGPFFTAIIINFMLIPLWILRRVILASATATPFAWPGADTNFNRAVKSVNWYGFVKSELWQTLCMRLPLLTFIVMMPEKYWLYLSAWLLIIVIVLGDSGKRGCSKKGKNF